MHEIEKQLRITYKKITLVKKTEATALSFLEESRKNYEIKNAM